jgi:hypothetical protein
MEDNGETAAEEMQVDTEQRTSKYGWWQRGNNSAAKNDKKTTIYK